MSISHKNSNLHHQIIKGRVDNTETDTSTLLVLFLIVASPPQFPDDSANRSPLARKVYIRTLKILLMFAFAIRFLPYLPYRIIIVPYFPYMCPALCPSFAVFSALPMYLHIF